jgi:diadenosine tetraphosphate (Ap4A) HIT family hydrolase
VAPGHSTVVFRGRHVADPIDVPHVHTHLIPRYPDDAAPGRPLPAASFDGAPVLPGDEFAARLAQLRAAVVGGG